MEFPVGTGVAAFAPFRLRTHLLQIKLAKVVGYIPQYDVQIPTLTVRETIEFAHNCASRWHRNMRSMTLVPALCSTACPLCIVAGRHLFDRSNICHCVPKTQVGVCRTDTEMGR